jgi:hypothetical protein
MMQSRSNISLGKYLVHFEVGAAALVGNDVKRGFSQRNSKTISLIIADRLPLAKSIQSFAVEKNAHGAEKPIERSADG